MFCYRNSAGCCGSSSSQPLHPSIALQQLKQQSSSASHGAKNRQECMDLLRQESSSPCPLEHDEEYFPTRHKSIQEIRDDTSNEIYEILLEMMPKSIDARLEKQLIPISKLIDAQLYKAAPSINDYQDTNTLLVRVKLIARRMFCKRLKQMKSPVNDRYRMIASAMC
mmetsp:Transcript_5147/g.7557  ORF Transcript_5147/g.7557 Transcript_5147/m.7557 type:complete len:167 (-) Transcript_5147:179-679(-)